jgi:hypothetical protein
VIAPNLEYRQGPAEVIPVESRRPTWPCRETIGEVTYDKETAQRVCRCGDQEIRRTPEGHYFVVSDRSHIQPCGKDLVVESLLAWMVPPNLMADFREFMPSVFGQGNPQE